jgi:uncharacterized repeat protein (TIGR01451 family)
VKYLYRLLALALLAFTITALAQNTVGGTTISNTARANFTDTNGNARTTLSNTVETIVQTVYSFEITPDDGLSPTPTTDFPGYTPADGLNETGGAVGDEVVFTYTIINNTNNPPSDPLSLDLSVVQATTDDFNLSGVQIFIDDNDGDPANGYVADGRNANDVLYTPGASTFALPAQGDSVTVFVVATIPPGVDGNDVALVDLIATNTDAVTAGDTGPNISFESNNIARAEVNENPVLGVAKNVATTVNNGDGTYTVNYLLTLENLGNVPLSYIQVNENLATTFAGATVVSASATSATFNVNAGFNGSSVTTVLDNATPNTLAIGATGTVTVTVTIRPGSNLGPYNNTATASAFSPDDVAAPGFNPTISSPSTTDDSTSGTNPDPDGDGNPDEPTENTATPLTFVEDRGLGLALDLTTPVPVAGQPGVFETTLTYTIKNLSDTTNGTTLCNVQIAHDLIDTFPAPVAVSSVGDPTFVSVTSGNTSISNSVTNTSYDGDTDTNLLATGSGVCLRRGDEAVFTVTVRFDPNGATGPFIAQATATGTTPSGATLTDLSDVGTNPDQDGDGKGDEQSTAYDADGNGAVDPGEGVVTDTGASGSNGNSNGNGTTTNENDPTPISFTETPVLGTAKRVVSIADAPTKGQFDVTFEVTVENFGDVDFNNLQITDDLSATFAAPATIISVSGITSAALAENTAFNGTTNQNLLLGTDVLEPAETATVQFTVRFDPNGATGLENTATASATTPAGTTVSDPSTNGTDPDTDGDNTDGSTDGDGDPDENTPTPILIPETPELGVASSASAPVNNGDGTYTVTYTVTVENLGNVDLTNTQIALPFTSGLAPFSAAQVESATITGTTGGLTASGTYNGETNNNLLSGTNGLPVGSSGTMTISVVVRPGSDLGSATNPYEHNATGTATSPNSTTAGNVTDVSQDGNDTDPDTAGTGTGSNTEANDDNDPTPVFFTENPVLGLAKAASSSADAVGFPGEFTTTLTFTLENLGDVELRNVQAVDNLLTTFASPATFVVTGISAAGVTANNSFNGNSNQNLLAGTDTLAVGATATVTLNVRFDPNGMAGPFSNSATASATSPGSSTPGNVSDTSNDGSDPDPDDDGLANEQTTPYDANGDGTVSPGEGVVTDTGTPGDGTTTNNNTPTPITFTERPVLGVAKSASVTSVGNVDPDTGPLGPFTVRMDFTLENLGNVNVLNLSLTDDLDAAFGAGNYTVTAAPSLVTPPLSSTITLNAGFNGNTALELIAAGSNLDIGEVAVIRIEVAVTDPGAFLNTAVASGEGPGGTPTIDDSDNGNNPDPNGDGNPGGAGEDDQTPINLDALRLTKAVRSCADANCATVTDATGAAVEPGQYLEYTVDAENLGDLPLDDVIIFDGIPVPSQFASSTSASAAMECSTNGGTSWGACPAGIAPAVSDVRLNIGTLAAGVTETLRFVVYVP